MSFTKQFNIGPEQVKAFADLVQDHNPVHLDPEFASTTRYKVPICHGLLVSSYISGCLVEAFGEGTIYVEQHVRFRRPVPVGSDIQVVFGASEPQEKGALRITTTVNLRQGTLWKTAIEGSATLIPGSKPQASDPATSPDPA